MRYYVIRCNWNVWRGISSKHCSDTNNILNLDSKLISIYLSIYSSNQWHPINLAFWLFRSNYPITVHGVISSWVVGTNCGWYTKVLWFFAPDIKKVMHIWCPWTLNLTLLLFYFRLHIIGEGGVYVTSKYCKMVITHALSKIRLPGYQI